MNFSDSIDIASHCARAALGMMDRHGVPAHPNNFAVWYAYVADRNPDLTAAVTGVLRSGQRFNDDINADLFDRFFGADHDEAKLRDVGRRIEDAVSRVLDYLASANSGASQYGQALQTFSGALKTQAPPEELAGLVKGILSETKVMAEMNRHLEQRLETSSHEVARLRHDLEDLRREASTDPLTGLANRKLFDMGLREAALAAAEHGTLMCLLMIDIDFFKQFNDTHGHQLGDQVLKLVARVLTDSIKGKDMAARYGGEEFSVILPETRLKDAVTVAETIRSQVATRKITNRRTGQVLGQVTLSVGVAEYEVGESLGTFVHRADEALYSAKRTGRNKVASQEDLTGSAHVEFDT